MKIPPPMPRSGIECSRNFKAIANGVTFRKLGPMENIQEDFRLYRADAYIVKEGSIIDQLYVLEYDKPITSMDMRELRRRSWEVYRSGIRSE